MESKLVHKTLFDVFIKVCFEKWKHCSKFCPSKFIALIFNLIIIY